MIELYNKKSMIRKSSHSTALSLLRNFLDENEPKLIRLLCNTWRNQGNAITYEIIRESIIHSDNALFYADLLLDWQQDYSVFIERHLKPMWEDAMKQASKPIRTRNLLWEFNYTDLGVQDWLTRTGASFVTNTSQVQIEALRSVITMAQVVENQTPDQLAYVIRPMVGLNVPQAKANFRYYQSMIDAGVSETNALKNSIQYAERQNRQRAMMISRTELAQAYNKGEYYGVKQAQNEGLVGQCIKVWSTADDERVCRTCGIMDGEEVPFDGDFSFTSTINYDGAGLTPPAHPNCRCGYLIKEVAPPVQAQRYIEVGVNHGERKIVE